MSRPVWRIVSITWSSETRCVPSPTQGEPRGVDRFHRADRVALDARHLHQAADRIAGEAEIVLHADLGGILDLLRACRRAPRRRPARRHRAGDADFALAADLGAGDRGVLLVEQADRAGREQEAARRRRRFALGVKRDSNAGSPG